MQRLLRLLEDYWGILLLLIAWEAWVIVNRVNPIVMPTPVAVLRDLVVNPGVYLANVGITLSIALFGLVAGMLVGTGLAVAAWFSPIASGLLNPLPVLFSSVPVAALIPVIARLLGYDSSTVLAIVVIITFFPSFVFASSGLRQPPPGAGSPAEDAIVAKFARAWESADLDALVALLTDDVFIAMPPEPFGYEGRDVVTRYCARLFAAGRRFDLVPTRANGQPAFGAYLRAPAGIRHGVGLYVLTCAGDQICALTRFDNGVLPWFGLPRSLPSR